ncbi:MAG: hypothetical protein AAGF86_08390, partial [Pseudomonadota bacterium]
FAGLGALVALFVARHRGRAQGRAEVRAENARAAARRQAELGVLREEQAEAAVNAPDADGLSQILKEGRF